MVQIWTHGGMLVFIVLNQCLVQVGRFHTRFRLIAVLAVVICLGFVVRRVLSRLETVQVGSPGHSDPEIKALSPR